MSNSRIPFCKICFDAKKPASEYNSHYVRATADPKSAVTCPMLLAIECRYCHATGHTISKCELRERNEKKKAAYARASAAAPAPAPAPVAAPAPAPVRNNSNKFALLEEEVDEPVLCKPSANSYSRIAAKNVDAVPPPKRVVVEAHVAIPPPAPRPVVQREQQQQQQQQQRYYLSRREYEEREKQHLEAIRKLEQEVAEQKRRMEEEAAEKARLEEAAKEKAKPKVRSASEQREVARIRQIIATNPQSRFCDPDEDW